MVIGPWASLPIRGRHCSSTGRQSTRPMSLTSATVPPSLQIIAESRVTPSFSFRTVAARPESSWMSFSGSRLKRPSVVSSPRDMRLLDVSSSTAGSRSRLMTVSPSRAVGRKRSSPPGCCPANSQRTSAIRPLEVSASNRGAGLIGRIRRAGEGSSPRSAASFRCRRPSSCGLTTFT